MSPAAPRSPVVVTGYGTISALGNDARAFWEGLLEGRCGIAPIGDDAAPSAARVAGPLPPGTSRLSRTAALALAACEEAVRHSGLPGRRGVALVLGTTLGDIGAVEKALEHRGGEALLPRSLLFAFEKSGVADALAARLGLEGPRLTVSTACASGASALLLADGLIRSGEADVVLAGGADALARITITGFRALRALDSAPCRPFDRTRRGLSLGEGAGMLVLESRESALRRRAPIRAEFLGAAQTTDGHHLTAPREDGAGAARAIRAALEHAGVAADSVGFVNAHGTGTVPNDAAEARALHAALGERAALCPVSSIKGAIGHTLGAAGAIEAIATVLTLESGLVPPTVGLMEPDPSLGIDVVRRSPRRADPGIAISNSFGFGGANAVLCLGRAAQ